MLRIIRSAIQVRPSVIRSLSSRGYSTETTQGDATDGEKKITGVLRKKFPAAEFVQVQDISGGCGSMYDVQLVTAEFEGKRTVLQHRLVNEALKEEIQDMHGLRIRTAAPSKT